MSHATFHLSVRTPGEDLYVGETKSIAFSAEEVGSMQLFAHHASLTATIAFSKVVIEEGEKEENFLVRKGLFLFDNVTNTGRLLALHCEKRSEISHQTAKEYMAFLIEQLEKGGDMSEFQLLYLEGEKFAVEQQLKTLE